MSDKCREAFGAWCLSHGPMVNMTPDFRVWQAAYHSRDAEIAEAVGALERIARAAEAYEVRQTIRLVDALLAKLKGVAG